MIVFAYDGSLNGDWVAHYAVRFAANTAERSLRLVHVREAAAEGHVGERVERIAAECKLLGVQLTVELLPRTRTDVAAQLLELVPPGATLVAGTRARPRNAALLAGTVSARLLDAGGFAVVAIRVVHPGVLGQPGRVLLPLAGHPRLASRALPLLRLLGDDLHQLHVLIVREVSRLRRTSGARAAELVAEGRVLATAIEEQLRGGLGPRRFELDSTVVVSSDAPREIVLHAGKQRSRLICLGASERTLAQRIVRGSAIERVLGDAPSDVAVYRGLD